MVDKSYLELTEDPVRFEAVNQLTNVFFDDSNKDVFTVRSGGVMGVSVKGPKENYIPLNFRMEDKGTVLSIKLSLDHKILAVQRTSTTIEFMNLNRESLEAEYSVSSKKNTQILGFVWCNLNELAIITDHGLELYTVLPDKKSLKQQKTLSSTVQWFIWCPKNRIVLLASAHGSQMQPVIIRQGSLNKLAKVDTEPGRMALERDVTIATLYNIAAILILRHQNNSNMAEVHVHLLNGPGQSPQKCHVLKLGQSGRFAVNVVDDLVVVHHQASKSSQIFDIRLNGESDGTVRYHGSVVEKKSFKKTAISVPGLSEPERQECELYSPNWVVFQPNIVIDAKLGCLWHIKLNLWELCAEIEDLVLCTQVLLRRTEGKEVLVSLLQEAVSSPTPDLEKLQLSFNHINCVYREWVEAELQLHSASSPSTPQLQLELQPRVLIDQKNMLEEVFTIITGERNLERILSCYLCSLAEYGVPADVELNKLMVTTLAKQNRFSTLQQLVQYGVITDSKPIAVLLLSLGNMHQSTTQMALDMLQRLGAKEEILEVLLSEEEVIGALKLAGKDANVRKFLQAAEGDERMLHSVLFYFRNHPKFGEVLKNDTRLHCFIDKYNDIFGSVSS